MSTGNPREAAEVCAEIPGLVCTFEDFQGQVKEIFEKVLIIEASLETVLPKQTVAPKDELEDTESMPCNPTLLQAITLLSSGTMDIRRLLRILDLRILYLNERITQFLFEKSQTEKKKEETKKQSKKE